MIHPRRKVGGGELWGAVFAFCIEISSLVAQLVKNLPAVKEITSNTRDPGLIPESGRSPGEGNGNILQYSCLKNSMDRGALWATVHGVTRAGHDLATKSPPPPSYLLKSCFIIDLSFSPSRVFSPLVNLEIILKSKAGCLKNTIEKKI